MNQSNRQAKQARYTVTVTRVLEQTATIEMDARSVEEAEGKAEASTDIVWGAQLVTHQIAKAKRVR